MTKRFVVIAVLVLIAVVAIAGFVVAGNVDQLPATRASRTATEAKPPGHAGPARIEALPAFDSRGRIEDWRIAGVFDWPSVCYRERGFVGVSLLSLIRGNPEAGELVLDKPQIELVRNAAGVWNYSTLGSSSGSSGSQTNFRSPTCKLTMAKWATRIK